MEPKHTRKIKDWHTLGDKFYIFFALYYLLSNNWNHWYIIEKPEHLDFINQYESGCGIVMKIFMTLKEWYSNEHIKIKMTRFMK